METEDPGMSLHQCHALHLLPPVHLPERWLQTPRRGWACLLSSQSSSNLSFPFPYRKLHSGMKTYGCELCGKRFLDSLRLRMHLLAHSGRQGCLNWPIRAQATTSCPPSPPTQSLLWPGDPAASQDLGQPCHLDSPSRFMEQKSHPDCVHIG